MSETFKDKLAEVQAALRDGRSDEALQLYRDLLGEVPEDAPLDADLRAEFDSIGSMIRGAMAGNAPVENERQRIGRAHRAMAEIHPPIADFDRMRIKWHPYHTFVAEPNFRSRTLNTDEYGFRPTVWNGRTIDYRGFAALDAPKGVVCGSSPIFGLGLSDGQTLQAQLSVGGEVAWFSLSMPVLNLFQQRVLFELFAPKDGGYCVFFP